MVFTDTLLVLTGIGVPRYSARGLTQTLTPIQQASNLRRSINGSLMDLSYSPFRKYASKISCADQRAPAVDGIWPGAIVTVECVCELAFAAGTASDSERTAVSGSEREEENFIFYRPVLAMRVINYSTQLDEYGAVESWDMDLEEI